jgi:hypothetical protein
MRKKSIEKNASITEIITGIETLNGHIERQKERCRGA